jgi:hypothetical protein
MDCSNLGYKIHRNQLKKDSASLPALLLIEFVSQDYQFTYILFIDNATVSTDTVFIGASAIFCT